MNSTRLLVGLACVYACGTPVRPRVPSSAAAVGPVAAPVSPVQPSVSPASPAAARMVPVRDPLDEPVPGPPNGPSLELATTPDGSAAITTDGDGGVRLWPTLDGHREPRAVAIASPVHSISIVRSGSGFLVASIDDDRALTLTQLDADGRAIAHRELGGDPAVNGTTAFDGGVLAWASDQTITWFGNDGATRGRLATQPGERVLAIAARGEHVIALVEVAGGTSQHSIRELVERSTAANGATATALAWGAVLSGRFETGPPIAVSPSGHRIAFMQNGVIIALALSSHDPVVTFSTELVNAPAIAFFDDDNLAISSRSAPFQWIDSKGKASPPNADNVFVGSPSLAPASDAIAALVPGGLALAAPRGDRALVYLGYRFVAPAVIAAGGSGAAALADAHGLATIVDRDLRERGRFAFPLLGGQPPTSLAWLGGDDWLVATGQLQVISATGAPAIALETPPESAAFVRAEPSTHLAATAFGLVATLLRWDADHRTMDRVARVDLPSPFGMIAFAPTNPALANGVRVVRAEQHEVADVQWYADDAMTKPVASARTAAVLAVDDAARVYAWTIGEPAHVGIFAKGTEVGALAATTAALFPQPSGAHVAAIAGSAVELYDGGTRVWSRELGKPRQIAWLGNDALAVLTDRCVTRLDAATGAAVAHRCGWSFGTWPTALEDTEDL